MGFRIAVTATEVVPIDKLQRHPENARLGDLGMIRGSLDAHGQYRAIGAQRSTGYVLYGNHTFQGAVDEGATEILCHWLDVDDDEALRIVLIDNKANDGATYDFPKLEELLEQLGGDYTGTGFTADEHAALKVQLGPDALTDEEKDAPPPIAPAPEDAITRLGDVYLLGDSHVLVCGDSLDPDVVRLALDSLQVEHADLVVTDPPYTVEYEQNMTPIQASRRRKDGKGVGNDELTGEAADEFVANAMLAIVEALKPGGVYYVFGPPGRDQVRFITGLDATGSAVRQILLWLKDRFTFGRQDYQWRHEAIFYGWRAGAAHYFVGDYTQDTLWECERPAVSKDHPTMKPVALLERAINNSSQAGEVVLDLFAGSGSTLVAAYATKRRCAAIEMDPGYCDAIVARWEKLTGQEAKRGG